MCDYYTYKGQKFGKSQKIPMPGNVYNLFISPTWYQLQKLVYRNWEGGKTAKKGMEWKLIAQDLRVGYMGVKLFEVPWTR